MKTKGGTSDFKQGNGIVRFGIWKDLTVVAMWRLDWSGEGDQLDLYTWSSRGHSGGLPKGRGCEWGKQGRTPRSWVKGGAICRKANTGRRADWRGERKERRGPELLTCLVLVFQSLLLLRSEFSRAGMKSFEYEMRYLGITMYNLLVLKQHSTEEWPFKKKKKKETGELCGFKTHAMSTLWWARLKIPGN